MKRNLVRTILLFLLALVFSAGLMYAFMALPEWLDGVVQRNLQTPHGDPAWDSAYKYDLFVNAYGIKIIGVVSLLIILVMIVLGFTTKKMGFAWTGAIILFLPVFGTFAASMFYLAGLGLFNTILYPFMDISFQFLNLGHVVMIPYWVLMWFFELFNWQAHDFLMYFFMASGAMLFVFSVFTWLQTYYSKEKVAKSWLYKISRHPQYLGWIIWSYGLMLYGPTLNDMRKSWGWNGSLSWLLSTMVIIGICLLEENKMRERAGEEYDEYRDHTPFLFPIPGWLKVVIKSPFKLIFKKNRPNKNSEVGWSVLLYTIVFMALSLFWVDFGGQAEEIGQDDQVTLVQGNLDSLLIEVYKPQNRRYRYEPVKALASLGDPAIQYMKEILHSEDDVLREFGADAVEEFGIRELIPDLVDNLEDANGRVRRSTMNALMNLEAHEVKDTLLYLLQSDGNPTGESEIVAVLSSFGVKEVLPWLEKNLDHSNEWVRANTLREIHDLDADLSWEYIYNALSDTVARVRRTAIFLIIENKPPDAKPHLEKVLDDEDWEVRFYARQVLKEY